ncbi:MAG TPA: DUF937 domain-containing protein [Mycobacterium sp.]
MADLDELYAQIPTDEIAGKLDADRDSVDHAIKTLVPVLVGGLHHNVEDPDAASQIESAATQQAATGLLDGGVSVDQVDEQDGQQAVARIFGGNDASQVATALSNAGAGNNDLMKQLLPIITPIVLAYIGKKITERAGGSAPATEGSSGGGLGDILGNILGGKSSGGDNPLGGILGGILGGDKGGTIGDIIGGLIRGGK